MKPRQIKFSPVYHATIERTGNKVVLYVKQSQDAFGRPAHVQPLIADQALFEWAVRVQDKPEITGGLLEVKE